jgi:hypothetical protein
MQKIWSNILVELSKLNAMKREWMTNDLILMKH